MIKPFTKVSFKTLSVLLVGGLIFSAKSYLPAANQPTNLRVYAQEILAKCPRVDGGSSQLACYNREIPLLMDTRHISMEEAFAVIKLVQEKDDTFWYCHVASHIIVAKEIDKDPSRWKDVFIRCPDEMCSNGCMHGAFQERFKLDFLPDDQIAAIMPDLQNICEKKSDWQPTVKVQTSCYHGLGHTAMYLTNGNISKSAAICQAVGLKPDGRTYVQTCTEGIFMQLFQPREPEDEALVKNIVPTKETLMHFCDTSTGVVKDACHREGWVLYKEEIQTPSGAISYCSYTDDPKARFLCLDKIFQTFMVLTNFDDAKMKNFCQAVPLEQRSLCFTDAAIRLVTADRSLFDRSVAMCSYATSLAVGEECFNRLATDSTYLNDPGSSDLRSYCQKLPDPWRAKCLSQPAW
jgi:hypothetical protein